MKFPTKTLEKSLFKSGHSRIIGVDEVGMGCLAGPVVVCAVAFTPEFYKHNHPELSGVRDSKLLRPGKRGSLAAQLKKAAGLRYKIASSGPAVIDKVNILEASRRAMRRAIQRLTVKKQLTTDKCIVLVDGNKEIPGLDIEQRAVVGGDRRIFAIACASVIAKDYRDKLMLRLAKKYPEYGFEIHKGYGTNLHFQTIREHGPSPCHRRSFSID